MTATAWAVVRVSLIPQMGTPCGVGHICPTWSGGIVRLAVPTGDEWPAESQQPETDVHAGRLGRWGGSAR